MAEDMGFYRYLREMVERGLMSEAEAQYAWKRHVEENKKQ